MISNDIAEKFLSIVEVPTIRMHEVLENATDPTKKPFWELDARFLNPFDEPTELMTWCRIGNRPAIEKQGITSIASDPKQGKSASMYALLMHLAIGKPFGNMTPEGDAPEMVIVFDTEMSRNDLIRRYQLIRKTIGDEGAKKIRIVPLKGVPKEQRMEMISDIVATYNPPIICFDTITRLVQDFNDSKEAIQFSEIIVPMSADRSIFAITHLTRGTDKQKGHLGSILEELATEKYGVKKEQGVTSMIPKFARNTDTENATNFQFVLTQDGNISDATSIMEQKEAERAQGFRNNFFHIFSKVNEEEQPAEKLKELIMEVEGISKSSAETKMKEAVKLGVLKVRKQGNNRIYYMDFPI